jgi:hypothetical protein
MPGITKLIHFVWLGGVIGDKREAMIGSWAKANPDWQVYVWIDSRHLLMNHARKNGTSNYSGNAQAKEKMVGCLQYVQLLEHRVDMTQSGTRSRVLDGQNGKAVLALYGVDGSNYSALNTSNHLDLVMHLKRRLGCPNISIKDLWHEESVNHANAFSGIYCAGAMELLFHAELSFRLNPGAAADILRLFVLLNFGGLYLDVDIAPLKALEDIDCEDDVALFANYGKDLSILNNNAIGCKPQSRFVVRYIEQIYCNYLLLNSPKVTMQSKLGGMLRTNIQGSYDLLGDIESSTANMSGPMVVMHLLGDSYKKYGLPPKYFEYETELAKTHDYVDSKNVS